MSAGLLQWGHTFTMVARKHLDDAAADGKPVSEVRAKVDEQWAKVRHLSQRLPAERHCSTAADVLYRSPETLAHVATQAGTACRQSTAWPPLSSLMLSLVRTLTPQAEAKYNEALAVKGEHVDALQYFANLEMERAKLAAGINVGNRCVDCSLVFQPDLDKSRPQTSASVGRATLWHVRNDFTSLNAQLNSAVEAGSRRRSPRRRAPPLRRQLTRRLPRRSRRR